jgi:hypothetical protein
MRGATDARGQGNDERAHAAEGVPQEADQPSRPILAKAVKDFRFRRRLENDTEAYRLLIQKGLEAFKWEDQAETKKKP